VENGFFAAFSRYALYLFSAGFSVVESMLYPG
jgi:hypothetical protein